jgi:hypothetical protein
MSASQTAQAWEELSSNLETGNVNKLAQVIEDHPNTNAAYMAAVVLADDYLAEGCNRLFVNKGTAQPAINKAIDLYESVRDQCRIDSLLERATFGLARARESKGDNENLKLAEKLYAEVNSRWPAGAYAAAASQRMGDLKRPSTKEMYVQFAKFDPKPAFTPELGKKPDFDMNSLPEEEDSTYLPKTTFDLKLDKGKGKGALPPLKVESGDKGKDKPKEKSAEKPKESPKAQPKEQPKPQPKEEPKEKPKGK